MSDKTVLVIDLTHNGTIYTYVGGYSDLDFLYDFDEFDSKWALNKRELKRFVETAERFDNSVSALARAREIAREGYYEDGITAIANFAKTQV